MKKTELNQNDQPASQVVEVPQVKPAQMELAIERSPEADRNRHLGGRSFYFFDFDDNVAFLSTPIILFHSQTKEELVFLRQPHNMWH